MIDTNLAVTFYDDRDKDPIIIRMTNVLYQDDAVCLCHAADEDGAIKPPILFSKDTGEVLTSEHQFWYAENAVPPEAASKQSP
jgi:hypothetical protein